MTRKSSKVTAFTQEYIEVEGMPKLQKELLQQMETGIELPAWGNE